MAQAAARKAAWIQPEPRYRRGVLANSRPASSARDTQSSISPTTSPGTARISRIERPPAVAELSWCAIATKLYWPPTPLTTWPDSSASLQAAGLTRASQVLAFVAIFVLAEFFDRFDDFLKQGASAGTILVLFSSTI